jgi:hypothetical protein
VPRRPRRGGARAAWPPGRGPRGCSTWSTGAGDEGHGGVGGGVMMMMMIVVVALWWWYGDAGGGKRCEGGS